MANRARVGVGRQFRASKVDLSDLQHASFYLSLLGTNVSDIEIVYISFEPSLPSQSGEGTISLSTSLSDVRRAKTFLYDNQLIGALRCDCSPCVRKSTSEHRKYNIRFTSEMLKRNNNYCPLFRYHSSQQ